MVEPQIGNRPQYLLGAVEQTVRLALGATAIRTGILQTEVRWSDSHILLGFHANVVN